MFRGATKITLDAKGRLAIPTRYRERIEGRCENQLVATVDKDYCILIYPFPDWEDIERKLVRLPSLNKQARKLQRLIIWFQRILLRFIRILQLMADGPSFLQVRKN